MNDSQQEALSGRGNPSTLGAPHQPCTLSNPLHVIIALSYSCTDRGYHQYHYIADHSGQLPRIGGAIQMLTDLDQVPRRPQRRSLLSVSRVVTCSSPGALCSH